MCQCLILPRRPLANSSPGRAPSFNTRAARLRPGPPRPSSLALTLGPRSVSVRPPARLSTPGGRVLRQCLGEVAGGELAGLDLAERGLFGALVLGVGAAGAEDAAG